MANQSILAAFERMWHHIVAALGNKSDINHSHPELDSDVEMLKTQVGDISVSEQIGAATSKMLTTPPSASIGQYIVVSSVDENGNVTKTEAVDSPYIENKTLFLFG